MTKDTRSINIDQVVSYLSHSFAETAEEIFGRQRPIKGDVLYNYQVSFCYLTNEIQRGPRYMLPKVISRANDLIARMRSSMN